MQRIVSDVGCAALVSRGGTRDRLVAECVQVHGEYAKGVFLEANAAERVTYNSCFQENLAAVISNTLERAGITLDQVRYLLPHKR